MKQGKIVVVTGASGGVGRAIAHAFGQRGDRVALLARGEAGLAGACAEVEAAGGKALAITVDVADPAQGRRRQRASSVSLGPSTSGSTTRWRPSSRQSSRLNQMNSGARPR